MLSGGCKTPRTLQRNEWPLSMFGKTRLQTGENTQSAVSSPRLLTQKSPSHSTPPTQSPPHNARNDQNPPDAFSHTPNTPSSAPATPAPASAEKPAAPPPPPPLPKARS